MKTAIYGGDPNWGRLVMAIGKPDDRLVLRAITPREVVASMMGQLVYSRGDAIPLDLQALAKGLKAGRRVPIDVRIDEGRYAATVWGCDLSHRYDINAEYMT